MRFGLIDASLNDVDLEHDQYPIFFLFKKGDKDNSVRYMGDLEYVAMKKFIFEQFQEFSLFKSGKRKK